MNREFPPHATLWIFISDSNEPRHLFDIINGVVTLRRVGVADDRIMVFTDHQAPEQYLGPYKIVALPLGDIPASFAAVSGCEAAVIIVTGHGQVEGIGAGRLVLSPHGLLSAVRTIPGLQVGAIIVCQCYAGVFDILDAAASPSVVVIGSTRLNQSVSAPMKLNQPILPSDGSQGFDGWLANIFMAAFFNWIGAPRDIDGDGRFTLADAYKYAGAFSNEILIRVKSDLYLDVRDRAARVEQLRALATVPNPTPADVLGYDSARQLLQTNLVLLHVHQEPWILHALLAREIGLSFLPGAAPPPSLPPGAAAAPAAPEQPPGLDPAAAPPVAGQSADTVPDKESDNEGS